MPSCEVISISCAAVRERLPPVSEGIPYPRSLHRNATMEMGETFEEIEHQKFGKAGFEGVVQKAAEIEKGLGICDLASFTPKLT